MDSYLGAEWVRTNRLTGLKPLSAKGNPGVTQIVKRTQEALVMSKLLC